MTQLDEGSKLAFIGLGRMGAPMATRLHRAGYQVTAYDLSATARLELNRSAGVPELAEDRRDAP